jgi:hypothetical protein
MKSRFPILVEYVAACLATALALSTAISFKHSHGLTDFIAVATSLAGLITIITVIPGLVFGIIYWLFAWLKRGDIVVMDNLPVHKIAGVDRSGGGRAGYIRRTSTQSSRPSAK